MKKHIYGKQSDKLLRVEDADPECGEDFCDRCGDCLHCYGGDPCWDGGAEHPDHYWVVYEDEGAAEVP